MATVTIDAGYRQRDSGNGIPEADITTKKGDIIRYKPNGQIVVTGAQTTIDKIIADPALPVYNNLKKTEREGR